MLPWAQTGPGRALGALVLCTAGTIVSPLPPVPAEHQTRRFATALWKPPCAGGKGLDLEAERPGLNLSLPLYKPWDLGYVCPGALGFHAQNGGDAPCLLGYHEAIRCSFVFDIVEGLEMSADLSVSCSVLSPGISKTFEEVSL